MNLLDFKYWILNESQKSYYTFEIPKRRLTELDEEYLRGLQELLASLPESMYELESSQGSITLTLHASQDELISSIYGDSNDITIYLTSPGSSNYLAGSYKSISSNSLVDCLKRANYSNKITEGSDKVTVRFSIQASDIDQVINRATQCATPTKESAKIDNSSFLEAMAMEERPVVLDISFPFVLSRSARSETICRMDAKHRPVQFTNYQNDGENRSGPAEDCLLPRCSIC